MSSFRKFAAKHDLEEEIYTNKITKKAGMEEALGIRTLINALQEAYGADISIDRDIFNGKPVIRWNRGPSNWASFLVKGYSPRSEYDESEEATEDDYGNRLAPLDPRVKQVLNELSQSYSLEEGSGDELILSPKYVV